MKSKIATGSIHYKKLKKILKSWSIDDEKTLKLIATKYFILNPTEVIDDKILIDPQKVLLFLLTYSKESKDNKVETLIELAIILSMDNAKEKSKIKSKEADKDTYKIDSEMLILIISLVFTSVVSPFIYTFEVFIHDSVFTDFARFCKNSPEEFFKISKRPHIAPLSTIPLKIFAFSSLFIFSR